MNQNNTESNTQPVRKRQFLSLLKYYITVLWILKLLQLCTGFTFKLPQVYIPLSAHYVLSEHVTYEYCY